MLHFPWTQISPLLLNSVATMFIRSHNDMSKTLCLIVSSKMLGLFDHLVWSHNACLTMFDNVYPCRSQKSVFSFGSKLHLLKINPTNFSLRLKFYLAVRLLPTLAVTNSVFSQYQPPYRERIKANPYINRCVFLS